MLTAVEYLKTKSKMTHNCLSLCSNCVLNKHNNGKGVNCAEFESKYPEEAVEKVEKWGKEEEERERKRIPFTPQLIEALKGRVAEGFRWIHVFSENGIRLYTKEPVSTYPAIVFNAEVAHTVYTEYITVYKEMAEKLYKQGRVVVNLEELLKEVEESV